MDLLLLTMAEPIRDTDSVVEVKDLRRGEALLHKSKYIQNRGVGM